MSDRCATMNLMKSTKGNTVKREICLVVDVETCGGFGSSLVYDLGIAAVVRTTGEIIESHSLIISDVFFGMTEKMQTAYYAEKIPAYLDGIESGEYRVVTFWQAWNLVRKMCDRYDVRRTYAYNAAFDRDALNFTMQTLSSRGRNFFPYGMQFCCIWGMACETLLSQRGYRRFALAHGFVSPAGNIRTSAECAYAYMVENPNFEESHTGLADVEIEIAIMQRCLRTKKRMRNGIIWNPWQIPQGV